MPEKNESPRNESSRKQEQDALTSVSDAQAGNTGLYGQGQYDSEGKPDAQSQQGKQLRPAAPYKLKAEQRKNTPDSNSVFDRSTPCIPQD